VSEGTLCKRGPLNARLSIRIDFAGGRRVGPGKVRLLELIDQTGSISAAGRAMAMSYRRAWLLVDSLNTSFRAPVVDTRAGGRQGGGAELTPFGRDLVERYRTMERLALQAARLHIGAIEAALAPEASTDHAADPQGSPPRGG
jgi:molybdate transport system regulatory protein